MNLLGPGVVLDAVGVIFGHVAQSWPILLVDTPALDVFDVVPTHLVVSAQYKLEGPCGISCW